MSLHGGLDWEWGTYVPGGRIEIEQGPWAILEAEGRPDLLAGRPMRLYYCLTQRDERSPHPLTWRSEAFGLSPRGLEQARLRVHRLRIAEAIADDRDPRLEIPHVSSLAFDSHHAGSGHGGSVVACEAGGRCIDLAVETLQAILEDADRIRTLLAELPVNRCPECVGSGVYRTDSASNSTVPCATCKGVGRVRT